MIGLAFSLVRMALRLYFVMFDMVVWACTLGKVDPRTRRLF